MNIEKLFNEVICNLREFVNITRTTKEKSVIEEHLKDILRRLNFIKKCSDEDIKIIQTRMLKEFRKLSKRMFIKTNNKDRYKEKMQRNIDYLTWVNKHRDITTGRRKYTVGQREIFYAYLGDNIGSEQNGRRPVVILQNNTGNAKGNTTIVAPVTTHQKRIKWDNDKHKYYVKIIEEGIEKKKYLDFYEVPLRIEGKERGLYGFVNIMHIREIDRKRIDSSCQGVATEKCFEDIIKAINKNLS